MTPAEELIEAVRALVSAYDRGERPLTEHVKRLAKVWHEHPRKELSRLFPDLFKRPLQ